MATAELLLASDSAPLLLSPAGDSHARFSRAAYHKMFEAGVLNPDSRVELIDGEIYMMLPIGPPQGGYISRLNDHFSRCLPATLQCRIQLPIVAGDHSEPEPDIVIAQRRHDDYTIEHPSPNDVALLVEVAHSSLKFDLGRKLKLYASTGIAEYWVVDIERKSIHVHRSPTGDSYADVSTAQPNDTITPLAIPTCPLAVEWLFR